MGGSFVGARKASPLTNAAGRGSGPHCPQQRRNHWFRRFILRVGCPQPSLSEVARTLEVSPDTLRRWTRDGIVPLRDGDWTPAAVAQARIVARLRERGHSLDEIREAAQSGRLAYGYMEELFPPRAETMQPARRPRKRPGSSPR